MDWEPSVKRAVSSAFVPLLAVLSAVFVLSGHVQAQDGEAISWTKLPGTAVDVSINSQGQAYVVAPNGTPWRWDALEQHWRKMSGDFVRISAAEGNRPWAVNADGVLFRYNGLWWENKDTDVADVAADALGNVYIAKDSGEIKKWNPLRSEWRPLESPINPMAYRIALDKAGNPWAVTRDGRIRIFDGKTWIVMLGRAVDIAIGGDDTSVIADGDGRVRTWSAAQRRWLVVAGVDGVTSVAVAPDGGPWAVTRDWAIMVTSMLVSEEVKAKEDLAREAKASTITAPVISPPVESSSAVAAPIAVAPVSPAAPVFAPVAVAKTSILAAAEPPANRSSSDPDAVSVKPEGITFVNTRKSASELAVGKDGSVFALDAGGNVLRWSNARKRFESFPGILARIAVDPDGNPWGISALGRVFRHTGGLWKQIVGATGSDIAIGSDGSVIIADASSGLYKLNDAMTRFERISGQGLLVAVAPDGAPWTIRSDKLVQRCATLPCEVFAQKAKSISIGPDGGVWIVSDKDFLMRLEPGASTFVLVRTLGHTPLRVAVGPNGYPWVVTTAKLALASAYFDRDEQGDRTVAASTAGDTTGSGSVGAVVDVPTTTGFTFSKNMTFDTYSPGLVNFDGLAVGENGKVYLYGDNGGDTPSRVYKVFNELKKVFETTTLSFPQNVTAMDAAGDGAIWGNVSGSVYKLSANGALLKSYTVPSGTARSLAISGDGTVYAVIGTLLYHLKPGTRAFTKFSNDDVKKVAVGRANDLWILDGSSYVQQYTGAKFENRPLGQSVEGTDIGAGADGSVYVGVWNGTTPQLKKWNAANKSFDTVKNLSADHVDVDTNGRPWIVYTSQNNDVKRGKN